VPRRNLQLHEYQAAELLSLYNIPLPRGAVAFNSKEAYVIARKFGGEYRGKFVVKAQVQTL
jgi:succinyl-CoA synthetase beta subunit